MRGYTCYVQVEILYKLQLVQTACTSCNLYKLQLVQPILYELQLVQTACTSCNSYRLFVQVATCTKSQLVHNIHIMKINLSNNNGTD